jgi:hypothetical protein
VPVSCQLLRGLPTQLEDMSLKQQYADASLSLPQDIAMGQKFAQLTVMGRVGNDAAGRICVRCQCKCGKVAIARLTDLRSGHTKSCGCLRAIAIGHRLGRIVLKRFGTVVVLGKSEEVHGVTPSTEWVAGCCYCPRIHFVTTRQLRRGKMHCPCLDYTKNSWRNMIQRCTNRNHKQYDDYGGRGIYVCDEWRKSFSSFVYDMGKRPEGKTIERRNPNGPYTPKNCEWRTPKEQSQNRRKPQRKELNGVEEARA